MSIRNPCKGSGAPHYADWSPDGDYPGAAVCVECSLGVPFRKIPKPFIASENGRYLGELRTHSKPPKEKDREE